MMMMNSAILTSSSLFSPSLSEFSAERRGCRHHSHRSICEWRMHALLLAEQGGGSRARLLKYRSTRAFI